MACYFILFPCQHFTHVMCFLSENKMDQLMDDNNSIYGRDNDRFEDLGGGVNVGNGGGRGERG